MLAIIFSKITLLYCLLGVFSQYCLQYGKDLKSIAGNGNIFITLFNIATVVGTITLIYYSYLTKWWSFIPMFVMNLIAFLLLMQ